MRLSVVIPTLDEAQRLPGLLQALAYMPLHEVVVADGGSTDATVQVAQQHGARVVQASQGRGPQLAAGAVAATGDVLWFLHADVLPPVDAVAQIRRALERPGVVGGAFWLHTVPDDGPWRLGLGLRIADLRSRWTKAPYGDQGIFVTRAAYQAVGGWPEIPILEDLEFSLRLARHGQLVTVRRNIRASGRRFEAEPVRSFVLMRTLPLLYRLGVPAERLAGLYRTVR